MSTYQARLQAGRGCGRLLAEQTVQIDAMGFPTPFPEPDSPELRRFAVRSPSEIVNRLRTLQQAAVPLTAFVDADASFGVVTLREVDEAAGKLFFAGSAGDGLHERIVDAPLATFVGYDMAGKVQFAVCPTTGGRGTRGETFATPIPEQLFSLQRRGAARIRAHDSKAAVCRIPVRGGAGGWEALSVVNIGTGGFALLTSPKRFEPVVGAEINGCRLDLPGVGGATVSVRVCHLGPMAGEKLARLCGCEFISNPPALTAMIERFVLRLAPPTPIS